MIHFNSNSSIWVHFYFIHLKINHKIILTQIAFYINNYKVIHNGFRNLSENRIWNSIVNLQLFLFNKYFHLIGNSIYVLKPEGENIVFFDSFKIMFRFKLCIWKSSLILENRRMTLTLKSFKFKGFINVIKRINCLTNKNSVNMQNRFCFQYRQCSIHSELSNCHY